MFACTINYCYKTYSENNSQNGFLFNLSDTAKTLLNKNNGSVSMENYLSVNQNNFAQPHKSEEITPNFCYDELQSKAEQSLYNSILENVNKISEHKSKNNLYKIEPVRFLKNLKIVSVKKVMYAVENDHPELFWLSNKFDYSYSNDYASVTLYSEFSPKDKTKAQEQITSKTHEILDLVPQNCSEYDAELIIHDYIVDNCNYQYSFSGKNIYNIYGCLIQNHAVCQGYAKTFQMLMCKLGIPCRVVAGTREQERHMWNVVKINNEWHHVDVTWESKESLQKHNYFNVSDSMITRNHTIYHNINAISNLTASSQYNFNLPVCNSMQENYYTKNAIKIKNIDDLESESFKKYLVYLAVKQMSQLHIICDGNITMNELEDKLFKKESVFLNQIKKVNQVIQLEHEINEQHFSYAENKLFNLLSIKIEYN